MNKLRKKLRQKYQLKAHTKRKKRKTISHLKEKEEIQNILEQGSYENKKDKTDIQT